MEMDDILLIKQDPYSSYELNEFKAKQELRKEYMLEALTKYQKQIVEQIMKVSTLYPVCRHKHA